MSLVERVLSRGTCFGNWNIIRHISSGANGSAVFETVRRSGAAEEHCALKAICVAEESGRLEDCSPDWQRSYRARLDEAKRSAVNEVRLMYELRDCPNVVRYYDAGAVEWQDEACFGCDLYIRMELLTPLYSCERILEKKELAVLARDVLAALGASHGRGIVHRDVKPANIFVDAAGRYKLGDFGIARIAEGSLNRAKTARGTPAYAAPEQFVPDLGYDRRADLYSLGLVLYELSNDALLPFASSAEPTLDELKPRIMGKPLPRPKHADAELWEVIRRACAFDPEKRYSSAEEMRKALDSAEHIHKRRILRAAGITAAALLLVLAAVQLAAGLAKKRAANGERLSENATAAPEPSFAAQMPTAAPTSENAPAATCLPELSVADTVAFGRFEQDGSAENGAEPLEWYVIDTFPGGAVLLSRSVIDLLPVQEAWLDAPWEDADCCEWLNGGFYENAFTEDEKDRLLPSDGGFVSVGDFEVFDEFIDETGVNWSGSAIAVPHAVAAEHGCDETVYQSLCLLFSDEDGRAVCGLLDFGGRFMELTEQNGRESTLRRAGFIGLCPCVRVRTAEGGS